MKVKYNFLHRTIIRSDVLSNINNLIARGLFVYMCSFRDGMVFSKEELMKFTSSSNKEIKDALKCLIKKGYVKELKNNIFIVINED